MTHIKSLASINPKGAWQPLRPAEQSALFEYLGKTRHFSPPKPVNAGEYAILLRMSDLDEAKHKIAEHGGYGWLLTDQAFWSVTQVVEALTKAGMPISNDAVARWFRALPHTQDFGGRGGLRASKNDLILYFANQMGA